MENALRYSGIDIIGDVHWGTHFCQFYQTKEDLIDMLVPYFEAGLKNNEYCMWITSEPLGAEEAKEALDKVMPDFNSFLAKGQIEIIPYGEWYIKDGVFDSKIVLNGWVEKLNQAQENGYAGLRLSGNTFWLEDKDWDDFVNYEEAVNKVIGNYQMIALCTYSLDKCNANEVIDVVNNHQFTLIKREEEWTLVESSKQKETEEALKKSEEKSELLIKYANCMIYEIDFRGPQFISVNDAMCSILGYTREELLSKNPLDLLVEESKNIFQERIEKHFAGEKQTDLVEYSGRTKDGRLIHGLLNISFTYENNKPVGAVVVAHDITKRKNAENVLRKSEAQFQVLISNLQIGIALVDENGEFTVVNPAFMRMFGLNSEMDILNVNSQDWSRWEVYGEDNELLHVDEHPVRKVALTGKPVRNQLVSVRNPGDEKLTWMLISAEPTLNKDDSINMIICTYYDITERQNIEEELRKAHNNLQKEIKDSNALYQLYTKFIGGDDLNSMLKGFLKTSMDILKADKGTIQLFDPSTGTMNIIGYKNFNPPFLEFFETVHTGEPAVSGTVMIRKKPVIVEDIAKSTIFKDSDSLQVYLNEGVKSVQSTPIISKNGKLLGIISTHFCEVHHPSKRELRFIEILARQAADIIQHTQAEEELQISNIELRQTQDILKETINKLETSNAELEQFAYVASHDLQEPLRMVSSFTQLLERRYKDRLDEDADDYINFIVEGAKRMKDLIDDLLAFSRLNTESREFESINLGKILDDVLNTLKSSIEENSVKISYESLPTAVGDPSQIRQLFQNLISNAIKFQGDESPKIDISVNELWDKWKIGVSDNGIGIPPEHHKKIFNVFNRLHTREEYPGTGIGLAICKKIIEIHQGKIWVESEEGKGSTFYFTLPKG